MATEVSVSQQQQAELVFSYFNIDHFNTLQKVCKLFAYSDLVPDMYKVSDSNPEAKAVANCLIALDISQRIGASALMVMQNMTIIHGKPSWSSKFLIATVNSCGRFDSLKFKMEADGMVGNIEYTEYAKQWVEGKNGGKGYYQNIPKKVTFDGSKTPNYTCIAYTSQRGSSDVLESSPISIKMAIQEGWFQKAGSKWVTMPKQMLMYRAASFWTNIYAPDLSMGMKTAEEIHDIEEVDFVDIPLANSKPFDDIAGDKKEATPPVAADQKPSAKSAPKAGAPF